MSTVKVKLGLSTWLDAAGPISWRLDEGVEPVMVPITLDANAAKGVKDGDRVELSIERDGKRIVFQDLYVTGRSATIDPFSETLIVSDLRVWWRRKIA